MRRLIALRNLSMGWFILTSLFGFLAYYFWRWLYPFVTRRRAIIAAIIVGIVIIAVGPWLIFFAPPGAIRAATDRLAGGEVARSLLGFILGFGLAYAKAEQPQSSGLWLTLGGATLLLALSAPHLD